MSRKFLEAAPEVPTDAKTYLSGVSLASGEVSGLRPSGAFLVTGLNAAFWTSSAASALVGARPSYTPTCQALGGTPQTPSQGSRNVSQTGNPVPRHYSGTCMAWADRSLGASSPVGGPRKNVSGDLKPTSRR